MNKYEFNVSLFGNIILKVIAENKEQAKEMVQDLMENIEIKNIRLQETNKDNVIISDSDFKMNISNKNRDLVMER